jgi:hypothetical protein
MIHFHLQNRRANTVWRTLAPVGVLVLSFATFASGQPDGLEISISGLRRLDAVLSDPLGAARSWVRSKVELASERVTELFGSDEVAASRAVKTGKHIFSIQQRGVDAFGRDLRDESSAGGDEFFDWLKRDKLPEMMEDVLPEGLAKAVNVLKGPFDAAVENANWLAERADDVQEWVRSVAEDVDTVVAAAVATHLSDEVDYGLEPGGRDVAALRAGADGVSLLRSIEPDHLVGLVGEDGRTRANDSVEGDRSETSAGPLQLAYESEYEEVDRPANAGPASRVAVQPDDEGAEPRRATPQDDGAERREAPSESNPFAQDAAYLESRLKTRQDSTRAAPDKIDWSAEAAIAERGTRQWQTEQQRRAVAAEEARRREAERVAAQQRAAAQSGAENTGGGNQSAGARSAGGHDEAGCPAAQGPFQRIQAECVEEINSARARGGICDILRIGLRCIERQRAVNGASRCTPLQQQVGQLERQLRANMQSAGCG